MLLKNVEKRKSLSDDIRSRSHPGLRGEYRQECSENIF
jgi:hypothetical protein